MVEINVQATVGICAEFMAEDGSEKAEVSVVIAPLKVTADAGGDKLKMVTGCNMWQSCFNGGCYYSLASHRTKKA
ncbi:hypothetical protein LCGC14_2574650 [marine sediment metagenome]|uniref:Uncharacterized protein n=1 Tax=marine sediment metagenome TaxID=412755 RepID=A0A0F9AGL3_9ZZZZ